MKTTTIANLLRGKFLATVIMALTAAATAHADYQSTVLADAPLAYYPINSSVDPTGTAATDVSGHGNNGTYNGTDPEFNTVTGPSAYLPNALYFDGFTSYVDLSTGSNPGLLNFGGPITMEAWVQPASATVGSGPPADIFGKGYDSSTSDNEIALRCNGGYYYGGTYQSTNAPYGGHAQGGTQTTDWIYLVSTYDGTNWNLYINSQLVNQGSGDSVGAINFSTPWRIGTGSANGANRYFSGNLTQVALYTNALTPAQVLTHYFVGEIGVSPSNAVALITTQPQPESSYAGGSVTFIADYISGFLSANQWYKNGNPILGKTNKSLTLNNLQAGDVASYSLHIVNSNGTTNTTAASLTLLTAGNSLRWSVSGNTGVWDAGSSANWINLSNSQQVPFNTGDQVLFDDTFGVPTTVTVSGAVSPNAIEVNASANSFIISGSGTISGAGSLAKSGSSTLEIAGANDFTGSVTISGGILKMDEPLSGVATSLGAGNGSPIVVTNGATLAVNATGGYPQGNSGISTRAITISGSGVGGNGALRSVGNDIYHDGSPQGGLFRSLTLAGDATIGGSGRWDLGQEGLLTFINTGGKNYNLTCLQGSYSEWHEVTLDTNLGNIDYILASGSDWRVQGMGSSLGNPTNTLTLHSGVNMSIYHGNNNDDNGYAKIIHVQPVAQFTYRPGGGAGDYYLAASLQLDDTAGLNFFNGNGGNNTGTTVGGPVQFNGIVHLRIGDSPVTFTNVISGPGGFVWDNYNNLIIFKANNTYAGPTIIGNNRTLVFSDSGAISQSALLFFGGNNSNSVRLDVSGRSDQTLTLSSGQTLAGIGRINGSLFVGAGATFSPAGTNTTLGITSGANATGTISVTNAIVLKGTTMLKLNGSGVNDQVQAGAGITYGGTLNLVNIGNSPWAVGNSFQVFSAASYSGSFANLTPATPGVGLAWDTSQLNIGVLNVVGQPVFNSTKIAGGNLIFSGTGGTANGSYYVLMTTNLTTSRTNWTVFATNNFDGSGGFSVTNTITPGTPQQFYLLKLP